MAAPKTVRKIYPIDKVIPNPRNDNVHPRAQIDLLIESIRQFGQVGAVLTRKANKMLIAGHAVHQAMREAGEQNIEVDEWDVDQRTADAFLVADNRFSELSRIDPDRRRSILAELGDEFDFAAIGFTDDEVTDLLKGDDDLDIVEVETEDVGDTFWISVRGPLAQQAMALRRLEDAMQDLEGVEVDLGTTVG